jgi:DNA-binding NarL/FixJ family response regulator
MKIKVLLADDSPLFRDLLAERFAVTGDIEIVAEAANTEETLDKIGLTLPDILLTEVAAPGLNGVEVARAIHRKHPEVKVVALTSHFDKYLVKGMLEARAWGYLMKNCTFDQLADSLRCIHDGKKYISPDIQGYLIDDYLSPENKGLEILTKRESEILKLLAEGQSIRQISESFFISVKTAGTHKQNIFDKMGFDNLAQLVRYAMRNGIVS